MTATTPPPLVISGAQLLDRDGRFDLRLREGLIDQVSASAVAPIVPRDDESVLAADGNLLLPGLLDHHCHLYATAAARASLRCGPPQVTDAAQLRALLARHSDSAAMLRGVGFHDSVCADLDRHWLDRVCPHTAVRIQHRSGMLWIYNSQAIAALQLAPGEALPDGVERDATGALTGRFYNLDDWLGGRLQRPALSLQPLSQEFARFGITGVTDTGVNNGSAQWAALLSACERGEWRQRLRVMGNEQLNDVVSPQPQRIAVGPLKVYLREVDLPDLDALVQRIAAAHRHGRAVAVHCVTRVELHFALEAIAGAGARPGDRIEHVSVADDHAIHRLRALGVTAVTQPHFIAERGDQYRRDVDPVDLPLLYRGAAFPAAGVTLAAGSDAPYGATDPWLAMRAAVMRTTASGVVMQPGEALTPLQALCQYGGELACPGGQMRQLAPGQDADLCLLAAPWETVQSDLRADHVAATLCGGTILYHQNR